MVEERCRSESELYREGKGTTGRMVRPAEKGRRKEQVAPAGGKWMEEECCKMEIGRISQAEREQRRRLVFLVSHPPTPWMIGEAWELAIGGSII